jgi:hypothetical protein
MKPFLIIAFASVALLAIAISLLMHFNPLCGEELLVEKPSPDGRYVAALMSRGCGATTPFVAHINLRPADSKLKADFLFGDVHDGQIWVSSNYGGTRFCWSGPRRLEIGYPLEDRKFTHEKWRDVTIGNDYRNPNCQ